MVAGRISGVFNKQALVSSFPPAFDFTSDITSIDKATTFMRQVDSALRTRGLLEHLVEDIPSLNDGHHC